MLEQHEVGRVFRDVDGLIHGDADVGRVQRGRIVDAVPEIADDVTGLLEREHDALLLVRIDLREEIGSLGYAPERFVAQQGELRAGHACVSRRAPRRPQRARPPGGCPR